MLLRKASVLSVLFSVAIRCHGSDTLPGKALSVQPKRALRTRENDRQPLKSICTYDVDDVDGTYIVMIYLAPMHEFALLCNEAFTWSILQATGGNVSIAPAYNDELKGCLMEVCIPPANLPVLQETMDCLGGGRKMPQCVPGEEEAYELTTDS